MPGAPLDQLSDRPGGDPLLVCETLMLFRRLPAGPSGIAGYVQADLGAAMRP